MVPWETVNSEVFYDCFISTFLKFNHKSTFRETGGAYRFWK